MSEASPVDPIDRALQDRAYEKAVKLIDRRLAKTGQASGDKAKAEQ